MNWKYLAGATLAAALILGLALGGVTVASFRGDAPLAHGLVVDGVLFLGDAASASTTGEVTVPKWLFSDDQAQGVQSLVALAARLDPAQVQWLAFAHTGPLKGLEPLQRLRTP